MFGKHLPHLLVIICLMCLCAAFAIQGTSVTPSVETILSNLDGLPLSEFFDASYREILLRDPERVTVLGLAEMLGVRNDRLTDISTAYADETALLVSGILEQLHGYDREALDRDDRLSFDIYEWFLDDLLLQHEFRLYDYLVTSFTAFSTDWLLVDLLSEMHPLNTHADVEDYLTRLSQVHWKAGLLIDELELRRDAGIVPPQFMIATSIEQMRGWLGIWFIAPQDVSSISPYGVELYQTIKRRFRDCDWMTDEERSAYTDRAVEQLETSYIPAIWDLLAAMTALQEMAPDVGGATSMPGGAEYLAFAMAHHTTLDLSADEIYEIGLAEVARIQSEMRDVFATMGYSRDWPLNVLWDRAYADAEPDTSLTWIEEFARIQAEIESAIAPVFDVIPDTPLEVRRAPHGGVNYYMEPAFDGSRPGIFYAQTSGSPLGRYAMPVVFHHEAIPGHHFQLALMHEFDLPLFRQIETPTAHCEGWALYAEGLAHELGIYEGNPLGNLERLRLELMRAARLVVEAGVHHLGWTHTEGAAYFADVLGYSRDSMIGLMPRYVGYPGQGSAYTIGLLKILELRQHAMNALGDAFNLSEFHNVLLRDGAMALLLQEQLVEEYIEATLNTSE